MSKERMYRVKSLKHCKCGNLPEAYGFSTSNRNNTLNYYIRCPKCLRRTAFRNLLAEAEADWNKDILSDYHENAG